MNNIVISVIMPTLNSARTIEESLRSIRNQYFDQNKVEILVIDGGSTDETIDIANRYDCSILKNERKLPEFAKQIGFENARGEWAIFLDSDEMITNMNSFSRRIKFLEGCPKVKNLVSTGLRCQPGETGINRYANYVGDPFSNFVYRFNGYDRMESMKAQYPAKEGKGGVVYSFKRASHFPLYDALGNMFNLAVARELYEKNNKPENFVANIFINMVEETGYAAMLYNDYIIHKPGMDAQVYQRKMIWRIKNNLFKTEGVGFASRTSKCKYLKKRKFLYILYSLSILPIVYDAFKLSIKNKDLYFLSHIYWNGYVFFNICFYVMLKVLKIPIKDIDSYGK